MNRLFLIVLCGVIWISPALGQVEDTTRTAAPDTIEQQPYRGADEAVIRPKTGRAPARITGEIGTYGEIYSVSDISQADPDPVRYL